MKSQFMPSIAAIMIGIDLFSGAGGMSLGASQAGVKVALAVESDSWAAKTFAENHTGATVYSGDIRTLQGKDLSGFRKHRENLIVFGGPPCQGFSWSNLKTRSLSNDANWLFKEFVRIINRLNPPWFVFENVQGFVNTEGGQFLDELKSLLKTKYSMTECLLNAKDYGVPQDRTRYFLVGSRDGISFSFPKATGRECPTVADAFADLPRLQNGDRECWRPYASSKISAYAKSLRTNAKGCNNHLVTHNAPYVLRRYEHVPQGGNWEDIPARLMKNYTDRQRCHTGIYHRLRADQPSVVIGNFRKNMLIHPTENRGLSVREAARIQSFPDSYCFFGSIGFQQQQVGNAVPPRLARAVFKEIIKAQGNNDA